MSSRRIPKELSAHEHAQLDAALLRQRMHRKEAAMPEPSNLGATGRFPQGKLHPTDEGEIQFAVGSGKGKVLLDFGKPITWLGLDPAAARQLGQALLDHAARAEQ